MRNVLRELADQRPALRITLYVKKMAEREPLLLQLGALHATLPSRVKVATLDTLYGGRGGLWEDIADYEWYAGI